MSFKTPRLFLAGGGNVPYPAFLGTDRHGQPAWAGYYFFPGCLVAALAALWWFHLVGKRVAPALALAGYAAVSFVSVLVRADGLHLLNVAVAPIVLGLVLAVAVSAIGIPMPPPPNSNIAYVARIVVEPANVVQSFATGDAAAALGAIVPALRMARIPVVDALRYGAH